MNKRCFSENEGEELLWPQSLPPASIRTVLHQSVSHVGRLLPIPQKKISISRKKPEITLQMRKLTFRRGNDSPKVNAELLVEQDPAPRPPASSPGCFYCTSLSAVLAPLQKGLRFFSLPQNLAQSYFLWKTFLSSRRQLALPSWIFPQYLFLYNVLNGKP